MFNPHTSNRKIPDALRGPMSGLTGSIITGLSGIIPYKQRDVSHTVFSNFRNPVTGE